MSLEPATERKNIKSHDWLKNMFVGTNCFVEWNRHGLLKVKAQEHIIHFLLVCLINFYLRSVLVFILKN